MKRMSDLHKEARKMVGTENTTLLVSRAGEASRASKTEFLPVDIFEYMVHMLKKGWQGEEKVFKLNRLQLIKATRNWQQKGRPENGS